MATAANGSQELLSYDDWTFLAEGNAHILLVSSQRSCRDTVLRIPKQVPLDPASTYDFLVNVALPLLGRQYLFFPRFAQLSPEFVLALQHELQSCNWDYRRQWDAYSITSPWMAELLPNCFSPSLISTKLFASCPVPEVLSVELKVKGGLLSRSPFLQGSSRIKLLKNRFQLVHAYKYHLKNKGFDGYKAPSYRPRDLCSGEISRVQNALLSLLACPGNNISVRRDGHCIFGEKDGAADDVSRAWFLFLGCACLLDTLEAFVQTVSAVLVKETALNRLMRMQALDVIDCEGCTLIFDRLALLCGSKYAALELLRNSAGDPFPFEISELSDLLYEISPSSSLKCNIDFGVVTRVLSLSVSASLPKEELTDRHTAALSLVDSLGVSDCITLLRLWLVSLTAKDASLILTLVKEPGERPHSEPSPRILKPSDGNYGEMLAYGCRLKYSLKLVDINCKPADKCDSKRETEAHMLSVLSPVFDSI